MLKKFLSTLLIFSLLFPHWPLGEECPECPKCEEFKETVCPPCPELEECICQPCEEPCVGTCLSEEETKELFNNIQDCEFEKEKGLKIIENLNSQIYMYIQSDSLYQAQLLDYKEQLKIKEDMIELVKPKWHENKYLWFGYGISLTVGAVILAGQIK